jgi:hypothetical protein
MSEQLSRQELLKQKRSYWKQHIEKWHSSGMTQTAYCQQYELKVHQFTYWKKRFIQTASGITFVPVKIRRTGPSSSAKHPSPLRLNLAQDLQIDIRPGFDPQLLRRLITTLRSLP